MESSPLPPPNWARFPELPLLCAPPSSSSSILQQALTRSHSTLPAWISLLDPLHAQVKFGGVSVGLFRTRGYPGRMGVQVCRVAPNPEPTSPCPPPPLHPLCDATMLLLPLLLQPLASLR